MISRAPTAQPRSLRLLPPADLVPHPEGHYRRERRALLHRHQPDPTIQTRQARILSWLRDNVHPSIPRHYYNAVLGHDLHVSSYARLYVKHFHYGQPDPFTGRVQFNHEVYGWLQRAVRRGELEAHKAVPLAHGWLEDIGLVSQGKVTVAFRDFEIDQLIAESSAYGDFKYHEVGTAATAEANTDTTLATTSGIARVTGSQVEASAAVYRSVGTVTADTSETWQEHGIFNASTSGTMMDRSLISPTVAVVLNDTVQFTYELSKSAEA